MLCEDSKRKHLSSCHCFKSGSAVREHSGERDDLRQPATIFFAFALKLKMDGDLRFREFTNTATGDFGFGLQPERPGHVASSKPSSASPKAPA